MTAKRALVVEDDPPLRKMVRGYLELLKYEVSEASDGRKAMAALREQKFELLVLDLMLPESSGYDVLEFLRTHHADSTKTTSTPVLISTPVLMMSARSLPEDRAHAEELGARLYLIKPFTRAEFTRAVRAVTEGS